MGNIFENRTQPQKTACQAMMDNRCCWTRGKVLGGSSVNKIITISVSKPISNYRKLMLILHVGIEHDALYSRQQT